MWRILLLCLVSGAAGADEVRLANGDRISGEVKSRSSDHLVVKTDYAGEVSVRLSDVLDVSLIDSRGATHEIGPLELATLDLERYKARDAVAYSGRVLLSAAYTRGNTRSDEAHLDSDFTARAERYRYGFSGRMDRRTDALGAHNTAWLAGANYDRFLDAGRFAYVRGSLEHDEAKDIHRRATAGAGYGVQLSETPAANVSIRGGLDYVVIDRLAGPAEDYPALGWGLKASFAPWGARLRLFHEQEGFWNLEDTRIVTLRTKSGVKVPLLDGLNATAQLNLDWEREPAPGRAATDSTLLLGLDYSF